MLASRVVVFSPGGDSVSACGEGFDLVGVHILYRPAALHVTAKANVNSLGCLKFRNVASVLEIPTTQTPWTNTLRRASKRLGQVARSHRSVLPQDVPSDETSQVRKGTIAVVRVGGVDRK
jgi:hypothetical protein